MVLLTSSRIWIESECKRYASVSEEVGKPDFSSIISSSDVSV